MTDPEGGAPAPSQQKLDGIAAYETAIDTVIASAQRNLRIFDRSLSREYNSPRRYDLLRDFLLASRVNRVQIVVHEPDAIHRDCPRLVNLLKQFSHALAIHRTQPRARRVYDPFLLADDVSYVHRFHYDQPRGVLALGDLNGGQELLGRYEEIWEASDPALSATTLGL